MKRAAFITAIACGLIGVGWVLATRAPATGGNFRVTSPVEGQVLAPGQAIQVVVESDQPLQFVLVTAPGSMGFSDQPPYSPTLVLPGNLIGRSTLVVGGTYPGGDTYVVRINVDVQPVLENFVEVHVPETLALRIGQRQAVSILGVDGSGNESDVGVGTNVIINSVTPGVVECSKDTALRLVLCIGNDFGVGTVQVVVGTVTREFRVSVGVPSVRGDFNQNDRIDKGDEDILRKSVNASANPEDPRDLNGDGVIDKLDLEVLKSLSCGEGPNATVIPGGGEAASDCFGEWSLPDGALLHPRSCVPSGKQSCVDGAPCDADGEADGICSFSMRLTLNTSDERLPECTSNQVTAYTLVKPSEADGAKRPEDEANRVGMLNALAGLGVLPIVGAVYTEEFQIRVPLKHGRRGIGKGSKTLKLIAQGENGAADKNKLKLTCYPSRTS